MLSERSLFNKGRTGQSRRSPFSGVKISVNHRVGITKKKMSQNVSCPFGVSESFRNRKI